MTANAPPRLPRRDALGGMSAAAVIATLDLAAHPEGGHYRETFRDDTEPRGCATHIYYLLDAAEASRWHRVDALEIWHHYAGAPLDLSISADGKTVRRHRLGADPGADEVLSAVVPPQAWQSAQPAGGWALVGCTVAPAFDFAGFELAPPDWQPG